MKHSRIIVLIALVLNCGLVAVGQSDPQSDVEIRNKRIEADNAAVLRSFSTGNVALNANRLDDAIVAYREGLSIRPTEPALLTNLAEALRRQGVEYWNLALRSQDATRNTSKEAAKKNWSEAAALSGKALQVLNAVPEEQQQTSGYAGTRLSATSTHAIVMRLVAAKVDQSQVQGAWDAYRNYIATADDAETRSKLTGEALEMLFEAGAIERAIVQAREVLKSDPQHPAANRVLGLSLFASGDKLQMREALVHLERYVSNAPDTDPYKTETKEAIDFIKKQ